MIKYLGEKFNKLTIVRNSDIKDVAGCRKRFVICQCECGNFKEMRKDHVVGGGAITCGCTRGRPKKTII